MEHRKIVRMLMDRGLTQLEIAEDLGLSSGQFISNILRDENVCFPPGHCAVLVRKYGIQEKDLLDGYMETKKRQWRDLFHKRKVKKKRIARK